MKLKECVAIVETLGIPARTAFVAFAAQRCLAEGRRHPPVTAAIAQQPLLDQGVEMLWAVATGGPAPDPALLASLESMIDQYETPAASGEDVDWAVDISIVQAARMLKKGVKLVRDPDGTTARYVAGAVEGPFGAISRIYVDHKAASDAEIAVLDAAVLRLQSGAAISRTMFDDIPDWTRTAVSPRYAAGRITGSVEPDE
jgi:hypothetical protein